MLPDLYLACHDIFYLIIESLSWREFLALTKTSPFFRDLFDNGSRRDIWSYLWHRDLSHEVKPPNTTKARRMKYFRVMAMYANPTNDTFRKRGHQYEQIVLRHLDVEYLPDFYREVSYRNYLHVLECLPSKRPGDVFMHYNTSQLYMNANYEIITYWLTQGLLLDVFSLTALVERGDINLFGALFPYFNGNYHLHLLCMVALKSNNYEMLLFLIENQQQFIPNLQPNLSLYQLLNEACLHYHIDMIKYLVGLGAVCTSDILLSLIRRKNTELIDYFLQLGTEVTLIHINASIHNENHELVNKLLTHGFKVLPDESLDLTLLNACKHNYTDVMITLLDRGAQITPKFLVYTINSDLTDTFELLLARGGKVTQDCLYTAIEKDNLYLVDKLIRLGADISIDEPLNRALKYNNKAMIRLLLDHGAYSPFHTNKIDKSKKGK
jgi:ankyrin repeat protein